MMMFVGALTGPVYDAGYFRELLIVGTFLNVFGHMMLSLCTQYWQVLLAQGFCIGIGSACLFVPGVAILSTYFTSHLALATGIAASGSSLGGVLYPIILYRLINQVGFGWSVRTIGFIVLVTLLVPNLVMKVRVLPASKRPLVDWTAFRSLPFMLFILGAFVGFIGIYAPFFYMQSYAIAKHITNENLAFYLLSILNSASTFGRILPNMLADHVGPMNMILPCALMSGVLILTLMAVHNVGGMITFTVLFGFFSGTFVSLPPSIIVHLSPNRGLIGTRMGMCFSATAIGVLIGAPIAGAILAASDYKDVWIYGGVMTIAGTCLMFGARVAHKGWDLMIRA
ncbi:MFS general substrate transporter [Trichodelitschia bisporula]|uniref:MFS general substrate transporter n=1 Tax=Trichodelitschia bisporula TaxID=703511 RepID=A0A6G1HQT2_9PEZI|nr:MFS general substrate transporter [Trichodelitschia bisporula]